MILLLVLGPLAGLLTIPVLQQRFHPPAWLPRLLASPWSASFVLVALNALTLALTLTRIGLLGSALSVVSWAAFGLALPLAGARRWGVALAGTLPYLLLILWMWARNQPPAGPETDPFMVFLGLLLGTVVSLCAAIAAALVTALTKRR